MSGNIKSFMDEEAEWEREHDNEICECGHKRKEHRQAMSWGTECFYCRCGHFRKRKGSHE